MTFAVIAGVMIGWGLGRRFKVPALMAATVVLLIAVPAIGLVWQWSLQVTALATLAALAATQFGYILAVAVDAVRPRPRQARDGGKPDGAVPTMFKRS